MRKSATQLHLPARVLNTRVPWATLNPDRFAFVSCPLCGSNSLGTKASLVINWCEFFIVQCQHCRLMWRNPMPDPQFLTDLYGEQYFELRKLPPSLLDQVGIADTDASDQRRRREKTQEEVRNWMKEGILPTDGKGSTRKLLEIGGGRGYLQRAAQEEGWSTLGLEISPHGIKEAIDRGLTIVPIVLDELCAKYVPYSHYFDLVVFFDFLEHVTDPGRVLRLVNSVLKPDGLAILRVPCIADDDCPKYHLVDHIFHFSEATVRALLEREGFVVSRALPSGRFPGPEGQVHNITIFATKQ